MITSINIISHKQKICIWSIPAYSEDFKQISELSVNITTDGEWSSNFLDIAFFWKNLLRLPCWEDDRTYFIAKRFNLLFGEQFKFKGPLNPLIQFLKGYFHRQLLIQKKNENKQFDNNIHISSPFLPFSQ